ncbi:MAG: leucyl aminopeptidase [Acidimicrobiaceae bacterium]|nr:leucyl aminopeptidase [Acidimicrobiaceae bacterium]
MQISFRAVRVLPKRAKAHIWIVTSETVAAGLPQISPRDLENDDFSGKAGQLYTWPNEGRIAVLAGVGPRAAVDSDKMRRAGAAIGRRMAKQNWIGVDLPDVELDGAASRRALVEGIALGGYKFLAYKSEGEPAKLSRVDIAGGAGAANAEAVELGKAVAEAQMLARDFVNEPGGTLTAPEFADRAAAVGRDRGLSVKVWDETAIADAGLGGILGVNRGSALPPRLLELAYDPPEPANGTLALVGKGIVFDAGGLSIKTGQGMMTMKCDMGGGAAVIGAMSAMSRIAPAARIRAFVPMTDNMLGGDATRPGDVLKIRNGKTIEVLNTDAEGRLILADALSLASESEPDAIIDLATLTGACMVALGPKIAGLMGNDDDWIEAVKLASEVSGERVWHLPLPADYSKQFESSVADMKNIGTPHGGALTAGLILQEFVAEGIPWVHLDIAGPAWSDSDEAEITKGGTGFGVRLLIELAKNFGHFRRQQSVGERADDSAGQPAG